MKLNHAITTAGRAGRMNDALEIFRSIEKLSYTPDLMSYNNIISTITPNYFYHGTD